MKGKYRFSDLDFELYQLDGRSTSSFSDLWVQTPSTWWLEFVYLSILNRLLCTSFLSSIIVYNKAFFILISDTFFIFLFSV